MRQLLFYMNRYKNKQYSWSGHILILELEKLANSGTFMSRLQAFSNLAQKT